MRKISSYFFSLCIIGTTFFLSCQENGQEGIAEKTETKSERNTSYASQEYERKLEELSLYMGEVLKDPAARRELFSFAKLNGNAGEIQYNLRKLFAENTDPISRRQSAILSAFKRNAASSRVASEASINADSLLAFINRNDISVIAPYLAENFDPDTLTELTVSWWAKEMETEALLQDPARKGKTPAIKFMLDEKSEFTPVYELSKKTGYNNKVAPITVDDDYAYNNPTVVFGKFEEAYRLNNNNSDVNPDYSSTYRDIDCRKVPEDATVSINIPKIRLHENTRNWPNSNRLYIWAITGEYSLSSSGFIHSSPLIDEPWGNDKGFKVSRSSVRNKRWVSTGMTFLKYNWKKNQSDLRIIVAARNDGKGDIKYTDNISIDTDGDLTRDTKVNFSIESEKHAYMLFNQNFDRCTALGENASDGGYGLKDGHQIYHFNGFSFYFEPEIRE